MTLLDFAIMVIVAGICGAIGQVLGGSENNGCLISILVGFLGAFIGTWIAREFHLRHFVIFIIGSRSFPIVWSIIGSIILVVLLRLLTGRR